MNARRKTPKQPSDLHAASGPGFMARREAFREQTLRHIAEHGWSVIGVFPADTGDGPPFSYTVGAATVGLPDLIIVGLMPATAGVLLNGILRAVRSGDGTIEDGARFEKIANAPLVLRKLTMAQTAEHMTVSHSFYGDEPFEAYQVVYPDEEGRFPWDEGYFFPAQELLWTGA